MNEAKQSIHKTNLLEFSSTFQYLYFLASLDNKVLQILDVILPKNPIPDNILIISYIIYNRKNTGEEMKSSEKLFGELYSEKQGS